MVWDEGGPLEAATPAPNPLTKSVLDPAIPSSSPAFATPVHPINRNRDGKKLVRPAQSSILSVSLPPATLRPVAFRIFTKKHNLNLTASALQALATFIGKQCGSRWRDEGLAESVLEEVAKSWKRRGGGLIVEGESKDLHAILQEIEGVMEGGRIQRESPISRTNSNALSDDGTNGAPTLPLLSRGPSGLSRVDSQTSLGLSTLEVDEQSEEHRKDSKYWFRIIGAFDQPRLTYNAEKRHFEQLSRPPSFLPEPANRTSSFRDRYNLTLQRLLRNESFQAPTVAPSRASALHRTASITQAQTYRLTPISNLLGRSGTTHVLLGLITTSPAGGLTLTDLSGSVAVDLSHTRAVPEDGAWFTPGMIVVVDGVYEEEGVVVGSNLGSSGGIGGVIGGKFVALSMGGPPCERRETTLGINSNRSNGTNVQAGFGWVDFLGVGSERSSGPRMRELERTVSSHHVSDHRMRIVIIGEVNVDNPRSVTALRKVLNTYAADDDEDAPLAFVLTGNFVTQAAMAGGDGRGSVEVKEHLDALASALSDFPAILRTAKFVFVPGDNDPWASASAAGAATVLPRNAIPDLFTSRIKKAFTSAYADAGKPSSDVSSNVAWTTNPARLSLFGPVHEIVLFRDDMVGRLRRNAIRLVSHDDMQDDDPLNLSLEEIATTDMDHTTQIPRVAEVAAKEMPDVDIQTARKLVKTILDQGHLSPFPLSKRPVHWDHGTSLQLYPLPNALALIDPEAPTFAITYEGCHVMNPGRLVADARRSIAKWVEYDPKSRRGKVREVLF